VIAGSLWVSQSTQGIVGGKQGGFFLVIATRNKLIQSFKLKGAESAFAQLVNGEQVCIGEGVDDFPAAFSLLETAADGGIEQRNFDIRSPYAKL